MANMPDINKDLIAVQCSIETRLRLEKLAEARGISRSACAASVLRDGVANVELDADDYKAIAKLIETRKKERGWK